MPHYPSKKQKLEGHQDPAVAGNDFSPSFDDLGVDLLANILCFFPLKNIMPLRCINKKSREAVTRTIPPDDFFVVDRVENYNVIELMTRVLPNLERITLLCKFIWDRDGRGHQWSDGEDPDEEWAARYANQTSYDIGILSNFSKLRYLGLYNAGLNGRYPFLFNFPLLRKLTIQHCDYLKLDLGMLAGLPLLKELDCNNNDRVTGNINSLRVLKGTLKKVKINNCENVEGNFMDLADFPHLKKLFLDNTAVTGDIRDIGDNDFSSLEHLKLPSGVYGGIGYEFQRISDANNLVTAVYLLEKQRPNLLEDGWFGRLSMNSTDRYETSGDDDDGPPFDVTLIEAGSRFGYRWESNEGIPCEVNWLDPEPDKESSEYEEYIEESQWRERMVNIYKGFHQPPTEEEYRRLWRKEVRRLQIVDRMTVDVEDY
jgi:hypothetical protein